MTSSRIACATKRDCVSKKVKKKKKKKEDPHKTKKAIIR
jgi:hypothetical protein